MVSNNSLEIKIGKLWNSSEGTTQKIQLDLPVNLNLGELTPISNLIADLLLVKLKNEISAIITDGNITLHVSCERCLAKYDYDLNIPSVEREFLSKKDEDADPFEFFQIDLNKMTIDLSEMLRQEIILHFPLISLCSKSCKGLCEVCGADKNAKNCKCADKKVDDSLQKPFKNLKSLMAKSKRTSNKTKKR
jgi:uncharacterized metal-binding protein YceD (DUF177 family)